MARMTQRCPEWNLMVWTMGPPRHEPTRILGADGEEIDPKRLMFSGEMLELREDVYFAKGDPSRLYIGA